MVQFHLYDVRVEPPDTFDSTNAVKCRRANALNREIDVNASQHSYGHYHKARLGQKARQIGVMLERKLQPFEGCQRGKGVREGIPKSSQTRSDEKLGEVISTEPARQPRYLKAVMPTQS